MVSTRLNMWPSFIYEYRVGWILTLWHTYFILIFAVISLILLCLKYIGEAPNVQHRACSTVKDTPQTHIWGKKGGAPLWRSKQCSLMSITESQLDAPFSLARSKDHCSDSGSLSRSIMECTLASRWLLQLIVDLMRDRSSLTFEGK